MIFKVTSSFLQHLVSCYISLIESKTQGYTYVLYEFFVCVQNANRIKIKYYEAY